MQTKHSKLTAKATFLLFEKDKDPARIVGWRYSWNSGETTDVFFEASNDSASITADVI
jgi:hypothetical protein|tara:strand:- start:54552 stop:54725 length:174 start_codon:yes stop_codon:yes gene_type:complete